MWQILLKTILPELASKVARATDGKKTISGLIMTAAGAGLLFLPGSQVEAISLLVAGVPTLAVGITHKIMKRRKNGK